MKSTLSAKRKGDAVINIRQNNLNKTIEIERLNPAAEKITGFHNADLIGHPFQQILPTRIKDTILSYVDFEDTNSDFASVARKIPNFQLHAKDGHDTPVSLKIFYLPSSDPKIQEYELLMRDVTLIKMLDELKKELAENQDAEAIDPATGLPSAEVVQQAVITAYSFVEQYPVEVSLAVIGVDNLSEIAENYGEEAAFEVIKLVGEKVKQTCREEDTVGHLGEGDIGAVLLDCNTDNAKAVLGRIKNNINDKPLTLSNGQSITISLSMAYVQIMPEYDLESMYNSARDLVTELQNAGGNIMQEV